MRSVVEMPRAWRRVSTNRVVSSKTLRVLVMPIVVQARVPGANAKVRSRPFVLKMVRPVPILPIAAAIFALEASVRALVLLADRLAASMAIVVPANAAMVFVANLAALRRVNCASRMSIVVRTLVTRVAESAEMQAV